MRAWGGKDKDGNPLNGTRDANLDKGWLLTKPTDLKLRCKYCDKWHDTQEEVEGCNKSRKAFVSLHERKAKEELKEDPVADLRKEVNELKSVMMELMEKIGGKVFQPENNEAPENSKETGGVKKKVER